MPRHLGGMGFRDLYSFNKAFLSKLGWGLIDKPEALWVRVLRSKYRTGSGLIPSVNCPSNVSLTWRGICRAWSVVEKGISWRIGSGDQVSFWSDRWLRSGHILLDTTLSDVPISQLHASVRDMSDGRGSWNLADVSSLIPQQHLQEINATLAAVADSVADRPLWRWSQDGGLKTNCLRFEKGMCESSLCPLCHSLDESPTHILRDCSFVAPVWQFLFSHGGPTIALDDDIFTWIFCNLDRTDINIRGIDWSIIFARDFLLASSSGGHLPRIHSANMQHVVRWTFPNAPWLKWNVDGSVLFPGDRATCGGVLRNASGYWVMGFTHNLESATITLAELWAILSAIKLSIQQGHSLIWIESDSRVVVDLINNGCNHSHPPATLWFISFKVSVVTFKDLKFPILSEKKIKLLTP
ncbi:Ribonuclease H-like superfamily [Sesbania bispinosa]|nr:Ribonuclease H-like superfamily [Sesbania bispinosa]